MFGSPASAAPQSGVVAALEQLDICRADPATVLSSLESLRAHLAWAHGVEAQLLAAAEIHQLRLEAHAGDAKEWFSEEVAAVLHTDGPTARSAMINAADLVERLPATLAALSSGQISPMQARLLSEQVYSLPDDTAAEIEARVLPRASGQTTGQFARSLTRAANALAPKITEADCAQARLGRRVRRYDQEQGMSALWALLPTPEAIRVETAINHLAATFDQIDKAEARLHGDEHRQFRNADQCRADALTELADHYLSYPSDYHDGEHGELAPAPARITVKPAIQVTVALSTLLGQDDQPGELAGAGPIPASLAREFAADRNGTWRRLVTDPLGRLVDFGTTRYRPPTNLDQFVKARYPTCAYPTCSRQASACELDHARPWAEGGPTNAANLIPLCGRHHHLKHEAGWTITHDHQHGLTHWTTPRGRTYTNIPDPLPVGDRATAGPADRDNRRPDDGDSDSGSQIA